MSDPTNPPQPPADGSSPPPPPAYGSAPPPPPAYGSAPPPPPMYGAPAVNSDAYASWIQRVGAYLIDYLLVVPFYIVAAVGLSAGSDPNGVTAVGILLGAIGYIGGIAVIIWNQIFRQGNTGWSIGKKVVGIRLLKESTGAPLGPGMTFVRGLAHFLDAIPCYVGFLWPLWDAKRQTFADKIIGTVVVPQAEPNS